MARTQLKIRNPHGPIAWEIRDQLTQSGVKVVPAEESPGVLLDVTGEEHQRVIASVDSLGKVTQYEVRETLTGSLRVPGGQVLVPPQTVVVKKLLDADPANVLGTASEEELLRREMTRELVHRLLQQLRTRMTQSPRNP